jgi:parallel beta-helix repeat protein
VDDVAVDKMWFNNGTANVSYTDPVNLSLDVGDYTFTFYANDTNGNENSSSVSFSVGDPVSFSDSDSFIVGDPGTLVSCGIIDTPGVYTLARDLNGTGLSSDCLIVNADDVTIEGNGHKIIRTGGQSYSAVYVNTHSEVVVQNLNMSGFNYGVYLNYSTNCQILNNNMSSMGLGGVHFYRSNYSIVQGNYMSGCPNGVGFDTSCNFNTIRDNIITTGGGSGLNIWGGSDSNWVVNNVVSGSDNNTRIEVKDSSDNILEGNNLTFSWNSWAIWLNSTSNTILVNNNLFDDHPAEDAQDIFVQGTSLNNQLVYNNSDGEIRWTNTTFMDDMNVIGKVGGGNLTFPGRVLISNNFVYFNSTAFAGQKINSSANVTLYGMPGTFTNPVIIRDGDNICNSTTSPPCYNFTDLNAASVVFNVSSWSNYSIAEGPDTTAPVINIISPINGSNDTNGVILVHFEATDNIAVDSLWFNNGTDNITYSGLVLVNASEGVNTFTFYANDTSGNLNSTSVTFNVDILPLGPGVCDRIDLDEIFSTHTILMCGAGQGMGAEYGGCPYDVYVRTKTIVHIDDYLLINSNLSHKVTESDCGGSPDCNGIVSLGDIPADTNLSVVGNGSLIIIPANTPISLDLEDTCGVFVGAYGTLEFVNAGTTPPSITVNSPIDGVNYTSGSILVNFSASSDIGVDKMWFNNGTANVSYTDPVNISLDVGDHTFTFYANDTNGNENSTTVNFDVLGPLNAGDVYYCGIIDSPGVYTLAVDVLASWSFDCFVINSDDVVLDGNDHRIDGAYNNSLYNHGIVANGRDNITIQGFSQIAGFYSGSGVEMVDSQNVDITRNIISNNWYNIYFDGVSNSFIEGNELSYAWSSGVQVNSGSNNVISGNSLTRDVNGEFGQGIYLKSTSNNFISENSITTENVGIKLESADSNTFLNNNLSEIFNNSFLDLGGCTNNRLVYNNSFGQVVWTSDSLLNNLTTTGAEGYSGIIFTNDSGTPGRLSIQLNNSYLGSGFVPSELNSSANITLYGMPGTFTNPFIAKDGVECTDCYNFTSLNAETVVFNVSSWSNYYITRFIDFTPPTIEFVGPTPADLEIVNVDNFNVSMATSDDYGDHYALLNFNNSLVGWWRFEGSDDYFLGDDSGNNNNGTAYGIITRADGMFGEAAVLNGISYIDSALLTASALNESGTINIWAKSDAWSTDNYLFNFGSSCDGVIFLRQEFGSMDLIYKNETGAVKIISTFTKPSLGTWVDYSVSWDSIDSKIRLYENGVIVVNYTWTDGFNSAPENQFDYLMFGHCEHIRFWNGSLDDITLFSRALSASEIASLYNATANQYNNNFTNLSNLDYEIQGFAVDGAGNMAQTEIRSITVDATYDLTPPLITVSSPVEGTNYTTDQIYIDFAAVDDVAVDKMWFNNGTANVSYTDPVNISLDVGDYTFTFYANDTSGNENSTLVTFMVDTIPPVVTIVIPTNTTYVSIRYDINIMLNEAGYCLFSLDGGATNQTLTNNGGTSFTGTNSIIADANYTLNAYCNDSAGNRNDSVSVNFSVKLPVCGNGVVEYGESCDAGADNGVCPRSCSSSCTTNSCGGGRPSCRSTSWNCGNWGECVGSSQSRSCIDNCASTKTETQSCTPIINCTSTSWNCGNWSNCTNSLQTRSCLDNCNASRVENQTCIVLNETCMPNWQCSSWGVCNNSISTRSCSDLNNCGDISLKPTESISCFVLPQNESQNQTQEQTIIPVALLQDRQDNCMPVVVCGNYSDCKYSASVNDLFAGVVRSTGTQSRECADSKKCISNYFEQRTCSVEVAVDLVNEADPCDLDKQIVAVVRKGTKDPIAQIDALSLINSNLLNVKFIQNSTVYCEKCYNGIKDDGEEDIDCGGSCKPCQFGSSWINLVKWILWILVLILLIIDLWLIWGEKKREDEIDYRQRIATSQMNKKSFDKSILEDKHIYENKKIEYSSAFKFNTKLREIVDLINKGYSAMDINEIGLARLNYRKVRKKYNTLNSGDKSRIRSKILEFYNEIIYFEPR